MQEDTRLGYYVECYEAIEPSLTLLNKIQNQKLCLEEYTLNLGQCLGFAKSCEIEDELLQNILIDNCGLNDLMLASILKGLNS